MRHATPAAALLLLLLAACGKAAPEPAEAEGAEATPAEQQPAEIEPAEPSVAPLQRRGVEIFFPAEDGDGLIAERHEIFDTATPGDRAKQIVADLISGPTHAGALRAIPSTTRLRQAYVLGSVIYLDFSAELAEEIGGGSENELLAVYAIVNSVAINVTEIDRVAILIGGRPVETLNGHVDLRRPLKPDLSLVRGSNVV